MENITLTKEDLSLAFETYISVCRDDAKTTQSSSDYFMVFIHVKDIFCSISYALQESDEEEK